MSDPEHDHRNQTFPFFISGMQAIPMTVITYAFIGFLAGIFTMTIISLYRYVIKKVSQ